LSPHPSEWSSPSISQLHCTQNLLGHDPIVRWGHLQQLWSWLTLLYPIQHPALGTRCSALCDIWLIFLWVLHFGLLGVWHIGYAAHQGSGVLFHGFRTQLLVNARYCSFMFSIWFKNKLISTLLKDICVQSHILSPEFRDPWSLRPRSLKPGTWDLTFEMKDIFQKCLNQPFIYL
jgi:hypothetical protein